MVKQVLADNERALIRADIYTAIKDEGVDVHDKKLAFFMRYSRDKSVLDLGCIDHSENNWRSRYWLHKAIRSVAKNLTGLDYYNEGVVKLKAQGFNIVHGDAQSFEFIEKFDVVTAGDLIEHLPNLEGFFKSVKNVLNDGGKLVITTPNPWCWKYFLYHFFKKKLTPVNKEHISWFCLQTLENLALRFDFKMVKYEYSSRRFYERIIPLPSHIKNTTLGVVFERLI